MTQKTRIHTRSDAGEQKNRIDSPKKRRTNKTKRERVSEPRKGSKTIEIRRQNAHMKIAWAVQN